MEQQPTFEQEIELAKDQFRTFRQGDGDMLSLCRLSTPKGDVVMGLNLPTADMRMFAITSMILEHKASRAVWFADAWIKTFQKDEYPDDYDAEHPLQARPPSTYEDRTEALVVTLVTADEVQLAMIPYNIIGGVVFFGQLMNMPSEQALGTHQQIQEAIRRVQAGG